MRYVHFLIAGLLLLFSVNVNSQFIATTGYGGGAGPSPLLDSLFAYYPLDESSGDALDAHGNVDLTLNGTVTQNVGSAVQGTCYTFVTDGRLTSGTDDFEFPGSFSIQIWIKTDYDADVEYKHMTGTFGLAQYGYEVGMTTDPERTYATMRYQTGNVALFGSAPNINDDAWHHIVFTYNADDDSLKIYDNTVIKDKDINTNGVVYSGSEFTIGSRRSQYYWDGEIDEVAYWRGLELSQGKIDSLYNSGSGLAYPLDY
jgi:hypothetical protein